MCWNGNGNDNDSTMHNILKASNIEMLHPIKWVYLLTIPRPRHSKFGEGRRHSQLSTNCWQSGLRYALEAAFIQQVAGYKAVRDVAAPARAPAPAPGDLVLRFSSTLNWPSLSSHSLAYLLITSFSFIHIYIHTHTHAHLQQSLGAAATFIESFSRLIKRTAQQR